MPLPDNITFKQAAAIPETFLTAWQTLKWTGELQQEETVLIHAGGSGVGTAAIQLAEHIFDAQIITTAGTKEKLDTCRELGADYAYNYHKQDFANEINRELGKNAVDLIIDFIGAPYWQQNIGVLNMGGRMIYLSFLGGHKIGELSLAPILRKRLKIMGSTLRSRPVDYKIELTQSFLNEVGPLIRNETIAPVVDRIFDWKDTEKAHNYMKNDKNTGKIVLTGM